MKLSAPKQVTFWVAVVIGLIGLVVQIAQISILLPYAFWIVVVGFVILILGNMVKGL